jgi:RNA polymerase sigma-70 factor (ECF subfamily)
MPAGPSSDESLLAAAREGDRAALAELVLRHQDGVYRFALRMCRDREDAKDIVQDTMLAATRAMGGFRGDAALSTWLFAVARSFCSKKRRLRKGEPRRSASLDASVEAASLADPSRLPDEQFARSELDRAIEAAIASLEPAHREALLLRDVEGLAAAEVAGIVGVGVPAVKSRLHRARLALRERLAPLLGGEAQRGGAPFGSTPRGTSASGEEVAASTRAPSSCPDVATLLSRHLEGQVRPDVCRELQGHVDACPRCRAACDSLRRTLAVCKTHVREDEVPPEVRRAVRAALVRDLASIS